MMRYRPSLLRWSCALVLGLSVVASGQSGAKETFPPGSSAARAEEVTSYLQDHFLDRTTGRYATASDNPRPDYVWGCGVMFSALVGAARHDSSYEAPLRSLFEALQGYWDAKAKIPGYEPFLTSGNGHDKYYDDNAWMVLTFQEAYDLTHDDRFLDRAKAIQQFVMSGWDGEAGGGIWWHEEHKDGSKNTCVNAPAAVACLRFALRDKTEAAQWLEQGRNIVEWTTKNLQAPNGLFGDRLIVATGQVHRGQLTYNAALMLRAYLGLYACTGEARYLDEAKRIGAAAASLFDVKTGAYRDAPKWSHLMVEADLELYRWTKDEALLKRARSDAEYHFTLWKKSPPHDLLANASLARELWLLADAETEKGRAFWKKCEGLGVASPP
jgi:hypothetical protein